MEHGRHILADELQGAWDEFCHGRNEDTFAAVYEKSYPYVWTICSRILGREDEVFDAVQSVFSSLLEFSMSLPDDYAIDINEQVRRLAMREAETLRQRSHRASARFVPVHELKAEPAEAGRSPRSEASRSQVRSLVNAEVEALPENVRVPLVMHHEHGMTHQEIADVLSLSRSYVSKQIKEGHEALAIGLRRRGVRDPLFALTAVLAGSQALQPGPASAKAIYRTAMIRLVRNQGSGAKPGLLSSASSQVRNFLSGLNVQGGIGACAAGLAALFLIFPASTLLRSPHREAPEEIGRRPGTSSVGRHSTRGTAGPSPSIHQTSLGATRVSGTGSLSGRVVSRYDGTPLSGFTVNLPDFQTSSTELGMLLASTTTTDADGQFSFQTIPAGPCKIVIDSKGNWRTESTSVNVRAVELNSAGEIGMNQLGTIVGTLLTAADEPIADEEVTLVSNVQGFLRRARTQADGTFRFDGLDLQSYGLGARGGYHFRSVTIPEDGVRELAWHLGAIELSGVVTRGDDPTSAAAVRAYRFEAGEHIGALARVSAKGEYRISDLPAGTWIVEAVPMDDRFEAQKASTQVAVQGQTNRVQDLELASGRIVGSVQNGSGAGVSSVVVRAVPADGSQPNPGLSVGLVTTTNNDGTFNLEGCPPGMYTLLALLPGDSLAFLPSVTVPAKGNTSPVVLAPSNEGGARLAAVLLSSADGEMVEGGWIEFVGDAGRLALPLSRTGDLMVSGLPPGKYEVRSSAPGHTVSTSEVLLQAGEAKEITMVVDKGGALEWTILGGSEVEGGKIACTLTPGDPGSREDVRVGSLGTDGVWRVRGLLPGQYIASATIDGRQISEHVLVEVGSLTVKRSHLDAQEIVSAR